MKGLFSEYGMLSVSMVVMLVFMGFYARLIGWDNGVGTIYNKAVAWSGGETAGILSKLHMNGDYLEMSVLDMRSTSDKLYVIGKNTIDLENLNVPKFNVTNSENILLLKSSAVGSVDEKMYYQDWIDQIGISTDGNGITVLVTEYTPMTSTSPNAGSGDFYVRKDNGSFEKFISSGEVNPSIAGVVLYSLQDVIDEFGNKVVEDGKVKQSYQVAYNEGKTYTQAEIQSGITINGEVAKKYKVTYRTEKDRLKAEYNAVFVNKTRNLAADDKAIEDLFNQLYKKEA